MRSKKRESVALSPVERTELFTQLVDAKFSCSISAFASNPWEYLEEAATAEKPLMITYEGKVIAAAHDPQIYFTIEQRRSHLAAVLRRTDELPLNAPIPPPIARELGELDYCRLRIHELKSRLKRHKRERKELQEKIKQLERSSVQQREELGKLQRRRRRTGKALPSVVISKTSNVQ